MLPHGYNITTGDNIDHIFNQQPRDSTDMARLHLKWVEFNFYTLFII